MSDKKISQLSNATTPLSGAEVFPVVQSGVTVKTPISSLYTTPSSPSFGSGQYPVVRLNATINNAIFGYALDGYQAGANNGNEWLVEQGRTALGEFNISLLGNTYKPGLMKINSVGTNATFTIPLTLTDSLYIGTSGKGIDFSATPGTGTSELLDDYEEGTWTPGLTFGGSASGISFSGQEGVYTRIGRLVHVSGRFSLTSKGAETGTANITGLPFQIQTSLSSLAGGLVAWYVNMATVNGLSVFGNFNATTCLLNIFGAAAITNATNANFTNTTAMYFSYTYIS